jgi:hypothetical protein
LKFKIKPSAPNVFTRNILPAKFSEAGLQTYLDFGFWILDFGLKTKLSALVSIANRKSQIENRITVARPCGIFTRLPYSPFLEKTAPRDFCAEKDL